MELGCAGEWRAQRGIAYGSSAYRIKKASRIDPNGPHGWLILGLAQGHRAHWPLHCVREGIQDLGAGPGWLTE